MKPLELPERLKGKWDHALILTYGADLPFFENAIWSQLGGCRNKVILADARQYLEACLSYAESGILRHTNQRYVVEAISSPHAAHAKAILLANPHQGRLFVGSGNLGWQGYASGGEIFTEYEYAEYEPNSLPAFLAVWDLVAGLMARGYVGQAARRHLFVMQQETPWLSVQRPATPAPVRHNLNDSFLKQLVREVAGSQVQELWMLAPFIDQNAQALSELLTKLKPQKAALLVQPGSTSADPKSLERVIRNHKQLCVRSFESPHDNTYVHAKLYIVKLAGRAICLQGSPNLSSAALTLTDPHGNIELANLLVGRQNDFDELLESLHLHAPTSHLDNLDLEYQPSTQLKAVTRNDWHLTWGEWADDRLHIGFQGRLPTLKDIRLIIADEEFAVPRPRQSDAELEIVLSVDMLDRLGRLSAVQIRWGPNDTQITNPIFVCNRASLDAELRIKEETGSLRRLGHLEIDDEEIEQLLGELEAALMIDRRSVWVLAGKTPPEPVGDGEDDDALRLDYANIDYDLLRRHPKVQQYLHRRAGSSGFEQTRLQIILNAITSHFNGLVTPASPRPPMSSTVASKLATGQTEAQTEEEAEEEEEEQQRRALGWEKRANRLFKNFIQRYLRGFASADFQKLADFDVMANNYIIFSHLLGRLFDKEWTDHDFLVEAWLKIWAEFWGNGRKLGYIARLTEEEISRLNQWVQDYYSHAELLAGIFMAAERLRAAYLERRDNEWETDDITQKQLQLRDFWQHILTGSPFTFTSKAIETAWRIVGRSGGFEPPRLTEITHRLMVLANFETRETFVASVCQQYGLLPSHFEFATARVMNAGQTITADCLVVHEASLLNDKESALALLRSWIRAEKRDYYRVVWPEINQTDRVIFYDAKERQGAYYRKDIGSEDDVPEVTLESSPWGTAIDRLAAFAINLENQIMPNVSTPMRTTRQPM